MTQDSERLLYLYKKSMDKLVKPLMSFEDWLNEIDAAIKESK